MTDGGFGARVREQRVKRGLSQSDLVSDGVSSSYVSLLESGRRQPTRKVAETFAATLHVDVDYLLGGLEKPVRQEHELEVRFAELALLNGEAHEARARLEPLLLTSASTEQEQWTVEHLLAQARERSGDLEGAIELLESLRERAEGDRARWPWLQTVIDLSRCYREAGDLTHSFDIAERAAEQARALGLNTARDYPRLVVTLAGACRERGDLAYGSQLLRRLLLDLDDSATRRDRGSALWNGAILAADQGHYADAILMAERAIAQFAEEDDVRADGLLRTSLAWMLLDTPDGDPAHALELLTDAHHRLLTAGMQIEVAYTETELARAAVALGHPDQAIRWAQSALERLGDTDRLESSRARAALASAFMAQGEQAVAVEELRRAAEALADLSAGRQAAAIWRDLADLHAALGDHAAASDCFSRALSDLGLPGRGERTSRPAADPVGLRAELHASSS